MNLVWLVALGGAVGSVARFLMSGAIQLRVTSPMPISTLVVNVVGSLLVGFLFRYSIGLASFGPEVRAMLVTGFCGGFTTFSAFSYEMVMLVEDGAYGRAAVYAFGSVTVAMLATAGGMVLAREVLAAGRGG